MTQLSFHGGADVVTGANYLLEEEGSRVLVDCGMFQGTSWCEEENHKEFSYDPSSIDAVYITHAHIDHVGRLPKLVKEGFRGPIYSTAPTKDLTALILEDSEGILKEEAKEKGISPLTTRRDRELTLRQWETVPFEKPLRTKGFEATFQSAGHILGSAFLTISTNGGKRIAFSGDLGNEPNAMLKERAPLPPADYLLLECVYGGRNQEESSERREALENIIEETADRGGTLLLPAFAMERTQELLYDINELAENGRIPKIPVYVDSPLAIALTAVYKKYARNKEYFRGEAVSEMERESVFDFPGLNLTETRKESLRINRDSSPKIIIAGSGMSQGGRILFHEQRYLRDPKSTLLFVGYQAKGSRGKALQQGAETVEIFGERVPVRCRVLTLEGYSAHADQDQLLGWTSSARHQLKRVFLVQGEHEQAELLAQKIRDLLAVKTHIPELEEKVELE